MLLARRHEARPRGSGEIIDESMLPEKAVREAVYSPNKSACVPVAVAERMSMSS